MLEVTVEIINSVVEVTADIPLLDEAAGTFQNLVVAKQIINSTLEVTINII